MKLTVNGREIEIELPLSLYSFLEYKGIMPSNVIVEYNGEIPERTKWREILLKENDHLEIVKFIGGG